MRWTGRITFILWITMVRVWHDMNVQRIPNYIDMVSVPCWLPKFWSVASSVFKDPLTLTLASFVRQTHYFVFIHISFAIDLRGQMWQMEKKTIQVIMSSFHFVLVEETKRQLFVVFWDPCNLPFVWATYPDSWHWKYRVTGRTPTSQHLKSWNSFTNFMFHFTPQKKRSIKCRNGWKTSHIPR